MFRLPFTAGIILLASTIFAQSPHGKNLKFDCSKCHTDVNWEINQNQVSFNHDSTGYKLTGQHNHIDCKACHSTLIFSEAKSECVDCHTDMHQGTTGFDCSRCHNTETFIVSNVTQIHQESRFPLVGTHKMTDCISCHPSESNLQFKPLGVECVDCHLDKYNATENPNHRNSGFSTNCDECHSPIAFDWIGAGFNHDFFPLTEGHAITDCSLCHGKNNNYQISNNCYDCHQDNYNSAKVPDHKAAGFSTVCTDCHTTNPDWKPAEYKQHDSENFPIYSGKHKGQWSSCTVCHPNTFNSFSCIDCHEHSKILMDSRHSEEEDYKYDSNSCLSCHPMGRKDD